MNIIISSIRFAAKHFGYVLVPKGIPHVNNYDQLKLHTRVRIKLLEKDITVEQLKKEIGVKDAAICNALSGIRPNLLHKINDFADKYKS